MVRESREINAVGREWEGNRIMPGTDSTGQGRERNDVELKEASGGDTALYRHYRLFGADGG